MSISQPVDARVHTDPTSGNRYMRIRAFGGPLQLRYSATVDVTHHRADFASIAEVQVHLLPPETMGYI